MSETSKKRNIGREMERKVMVKIRARREGFLCFSVYLVKLCSPNPSVLPSRKEEHEEYPGYLVILLNLMAGLHFGKSKSISSSAHPLFCSH